MVAAVAELSGQAAARPVPAEVTQVRILIWHLHGSWMTSFVQGPHDYLVPVTPDRGPFGLGRARTWDWPARVVEVTPPNSCAARPSIMVVLQRPEELALAADVAGPGAGTGRAGGVRRA